ncbi:pre-mRNA-splicing factor Cwc25p [[Candida] jaroonii]|uniref:Pre-mRNA-splicing factor Cwc25p n=1 Tax=[Candida] jaroonii TaxID=467808 RepID=A0ACA9Y8R5_9ASCO|nr:pre-mRNA-splicing factor Cwc25p [[Candida] jaroonii]
MPGDLNLKKSWNPALVKTQAKIWQQEQKTLEEFNKIKQREEELKKEKELNDLIALKYKFNDNMNKQDKLKLNKLNWMYDVPAQKEKPKEVKVEKVETKVDIQDPMKKFKEMDPMKDMNRKERVHKSSHSHRSSSHRSSHRSSTHRSDSHRSHRSHRSHDDDRSHKSDSHKSDSHKSDSHKSHSHRSRSDTHRSRSDSTKDGSRESETKPKPIQY